MSAEPSFIDRLKARPTAFWLRLTCALLVVLAAVSGGLIDGAPPFGEELHRIRVHRAGYIVLEAELHAHTRFSDGVLTPFDLVLDARRKRLDVIAISEHNALYPSKLGRAFARHLDDAPIVIVSEEVTTRDVHMLAYGLERTVDARNPPSKFIDDVHAQGGVIIVAHPTRRFWPAILPVCDKLDGIEVVHPIASRSSSPLGSYAQIEELATERCAGENLAMIGNSDFHAGSGLGRYRTYLFVEEATEKGVIDAIRDARTVTFAPSGRAWGPPHLVAALRENPAPARAPRTSLRSFSVFDAITRAAGLFGLIGLLVIRKSASKPPR